MTKKKLALVIVAVIAVIGSIVGVVMFRSNGDKTAGNGNETSSATSVSDTTSKEDTTSKDETTSTTSKEDTTTTDTSSDTTSTTPKDDTTSKTEPSTPSTTNLEQGKEGDRPMAEVVNDAIKLSNGKEIKIADLTLLEEDIVLDSYGGLVAKSYNNWANRIGIPEEDRVYFKTIIDGERVVYCAETIENILNKNGYTDEIKIREYLNDIGYN